MIGVNSVDKFCSLNGSIQLPRPNLVDESPPAMGRVHGSTTNFDVFLVRFLISLAILFSNLVFLSICFINSLASKREMMVWWLSERIGCIVESDGGRNKNINPSTATNKGN